MEYNETIERDKLFVPPEQNPVGPAFKNQRISDSLFLNQTASFIVTTFQTPRAVPLID